MKTEHMGGSAKVSVNDLHAFCAAALTKVGVSNADAGTTADVLATTDAWGVFTHGVKALRGYVRRLRAGGLRADARPETDGQIDPVECVIRVGIDIYLDR